MKHPETLSQLLRLAAGPLWKGKAYERTAHRNVEEFVELVGDLYLDEVNAVTLDTWRAAQTVSESTINRKLTNVHQVLKFAHERDWIAKVPSIKWEKEPEGRVRWLSKEEEDQMFSLLESWGETAVAKFVRVLIETGMRRGELLSAQPDQIDGRWLRLWKTKTNKARSVPLNDKALEALQGSLPWSVTEGKLRVVWDRLRVAMALEEDADFVMHTLRHTAATRTLSKTKNLATVQKLLGHRKVQTTMRYAHLDDSELLAAVM